MRLSFLRTREGAGGGEGKEGREKIFGSSLVTGIFLGGRKGIAFFHSFLSREGGGKNSDRDQKKHIFKAAWYSTEKRRINSPYLSLFYLYRYLGARGRRGGKGGPGNVLFDLSLAGGSGISPAERKKRGSALTSF